MDGLGNETRRDVTLGAAAAAGLLLSGLSGCAEGVGSSEQSANAPATQVGEPQARLQALRQRYRFDKVWFRTVIPGRAPVEVATYGSPDIGLPVASLSKSVTGIGIALLIQDGRMRLDTTLGEALAANFAKRGSRLDPSLENVTVERLLTHRAGLQTNYSSDPLNGLSSGRIIRQIGGTHDFFEYVAAANGAKSNGSTEFSYSNIGYLLLGLVIEAASGQPYEEFCELRIFAPLEIRGATIPAGYRLVSPYAGWHMTMADMMRVWNAFDANAPTVLTRLTLEKTLLAPLGQPTGQNGMLFYTLGVNVLHGPPGAPYVVNHNGIADFITGEPKRYAFLEKMVPGPTWMVEFESGSRDVEGAERRAVNFDVRDIVANLGAGR